MSGRWIDAEEWLAIVERDRGPLLPDEPRPLTFDGAARLAWLTGRVWEHRSDGTTRIWLASCAVSATGGCATSRRGTGERR